jgi:2-amino-4-hydroxy-6-hydroxymethyldihydropteridine diphosphokinase
MGMDNVALVALGSNIPDSRGRAPAAACRAAAAALRRLPGLRLVALSRLYRSPAWPPGSGAPDYVNAVARLAGRVEDPAALLAALLATEAAHGRVRSTPNAPRPLDLDLIDLDGQVRSGPDPILPHPRAQDRRFVLAPLAEVAPGWVHPVLGEPVEALLARLPPDGTAPLGPDRG